jgi:hypothetical protein
MAIQPNPNHDFITRHHSPININMLEKLDTTRSSDRKSAVLHYRALAHVNTGDHAVITAAVA